MSSLYLVGVILVSSQGPPQYKSTAKGGKCILLIALSQITADALICQKSFFKNQNIIS